MEDRYITTDQSGWLRVKLEPSGEVVSLPQFLKVCFELRQGGRDYFGIVEGVYKGSNASVCSKSGSASWLGSPMPGYKGPCTLLFKRRACEMLTPIGRLRIVDNGPRSIQKGVHPVQLPDYPHARGRRYLDATPKAMSWFHIGTGRAVPGTNDRYLHPGRISAGSVTVEDLSRWDRLYNLLIRSRAPGGRNVAMLTVVD